MLGDAISPWRARSLRRQPADPEPPSPSEYWLNEQHEGAIGACQFALSHGSRHSCRRWRKPQGLTEAKAFEPSSERSRTTGPCELKQTPTVRSFELKPKRATCG